MPFLIWQDVVIVEARHQYHFNLRPLSRDPRSQVYAIHIWHRDVCQEQMYLAAEAFRPFKRAFTAVCGDNAKFIGQQVSEIF